MSEEIIVVAKRKSVFKHISRLLKESELEIDTFRQANSFESGKESLKSSHFSLIIRELTDDEESVNEVISELEKHDSSVPVILFRDAFTLEESVALVKAGAADLIQTKNLDSRLIPSCKNIITQLDEVERNLKISSLNRDLEEILNNHIINSLPGIFYVIDKNGQIISVNDLFQQLFPYEPGADNHFTKFVAEEFVQASIESFDTTMKYASHEVELDLVTREGEKIPFLLSGITTTVNDEVILVGTGTNIKDRKSVEKDLRNEQSFIDKALDSLPGLFYVLDENMNYMRVNKAFIQLLGYSWEEIQQMNPLDFYFEEDHERMVKIIEKAFIEGSASTTAKLKTKEGRSPHFLLTGSYFTQDGKNYILGTGVEITQQVNLENLLSQAQRLAKIGAWEYDMVTEKINWTKVTREILEVDANYEPDLESALKFYIGDSRKKVTNAVNRAIETGENYDLELKMKTGKGNIKWVRTLGEASFQDGKCVRLHGSYQDVTDKKLAEDQIKESLQEKEILLMEIHHRVKNNLALVSGLMQLQAFQTDDEIVYKYLNDNQSRIKSISLIHEQLYQNLDFTFIRLDEQTANLVEHISNSINSGKNVEVNLELEEIVVNINQAVPFTLILNEVISNAYTHAFSGEEQGKITISLSNIDGMITLIVEDNGVGLPNDINLENPDSLGLTLMKTLSEQIKGKVKIEPTDSGTRTCLKFKKDDRIRGASSNFV